MLRLLSRLKHSPKTAPIRWYTNLLYYDKNMVNLDTRVVDIVQVDGYKWKMSDQINSLQKVEGNLWFSNIKKEDIGVDIGANIGAITIPLASRAKKVYSIEPLFYKELRENIVLNKLTNVEILKYAIGTKSGEHIKIRFSSKEEIVPLLSFRDLKKSIGAQIGWLKMDGEGCEWSFSPEELEGIRELRIEFHIFRGQVKKCMGKYKEYIDWLIKKGYKIHIEVPKVGLDPYNLRNYILIASLEK